MGDERRGSEAKEETDIWKKYKRYNLGFFTYTCMQSFHNRLTLFQSVLPILIKQYPRCYKLQCQGKISKSPSAKCCQQQLKNEICYDLWLIFKALAIRL